MTILPSGPAYQGLADHRVVVLRFDRAPPFQRWRARWLVYAAMGLAMTMGVGGCCVGVAWV